MLTTELNGLWKSEDGSMLINITGHEFKTFKIFYTILSKHKYIPLFSQFRDLEGLMAPVLSFVSVIPNHNKQLYINLKDLCLPSKSSTVCSYFDIATGINLEGKHIYINSEGLKE